MIHADPFFTLHVWETGGSRVLPCGSLSAPWLRLRGGPGSGGRDPGGGEAARQGDDVQVLLLGAADGGAKAGVRFPDGLSQDERLRVFGRLGQRLAPILRANLYHPWPDLNCGPSEIGAMLAGAGLPAGAMPDTAYYTVLTVLGSLVATAEFLGLKPEDCRVSIEGLERVGMQLAREVRDWGGKLVAASTVHGTIANPGGLSIDAVERARERRGDAFVSEAGEWERLPREELFGVPADIVVPCARVGSLDAEISARLEAKAVVSGAEREGG